MKTTSIWKHQRISLTAGIVLAATFVISAFFLTGEKVSNGAPAVYFSLVTCVLMLIAFALSHHYLSLLEVWTESKKQHEGKNIPADQFQGDQRCYAIVHDYNWVYFLAGERSDSARWYSGKDRTRFRGKGGTKEEEMIFTGEMVRSQPHYRVIRKDGNVIEFYNPVPGKVTVRISDPPEHSK